MRQAVLLTLFIIISSLSVPLALPARAADAQPPLACLGTAEQGAAIKARQAIPLADAIKNARARGQRGEVVRARLCRRGDGLVYVLTLLGRSGKVAAVTVDAANGELINGR